MLLAAISQYFFGIAIFVSSMFLIMLVLVQRGRGGGLTGALGGPGGQSAFGTKAGDLFTKITIGVAVVWILLCAMSVYFLKARGLPQLGSGASSSAVGSLGGTDTGSTGLDGTSGADSTLGGDGLGTTGLGDSSLGDSGLGSPTGSALGGTSGLSLPPVDFGSTDASEEETSTADSAAMETLENTEAEITDLPSDELGTTSTEATPPESDTPSGDTTSGDGDGQ